MSGAVDSVLPTLKLDYCFGGDATKVVHFKSDSNSSLIRSLTLVTRFGLSIYFPTQLHQQIDDYLKALDLEPARVTSCEVNFPGQIIYCWYAKDKVRRVFDEVVAKTNTIDQAQAQWTLSSIVDASYN